MKIRPLEKADRAIWQELLDAYAVFYKTSVPEGGYDRVWAWIFDPENDFWCDVIVDDSGKRMFICSDTDWCGRRQ